MSILLITHNDLDGAGCAVMMKVVHGESCKYLSVNYGFESEDIYNEIMSSDLTVIADMSVSDDFAVRLNDLIRLHNKRILLFDHHESAMSRLSQYDWCHFDMSRCGTLLMTKYHLASYDNYETMLKYSKFVSLVNDYDLWIHKDKRSSDLNHLLWSLGFDRFVERFVSNGNVEFNEEELELINNRKLLIDRTYEDLVLGMRIYKDNHGHYFGYASSNNSPGFSIAASRILDDFPKIEYLVVAQTNFDKISFRSREVNVGLIAESLDGGGHKLAAGAPLSQFLDVPASVINRKITKHTLLL